MVVRPVGFSQAWTDTVLINHLGEFEWNRDSIIPGFYRLEKSPDEGLTFFLIKGSAVFVDAQYINYPEGAKVQGSDITHNILEIEKNSRNWLTEIERLSKRTKESKWVATEANKQKLNSDFDSIRFIYRNEALNLSANPLVRFLALQQQAGNNLLFDPWSDRNFFFEADSGLKPYKRYAEIKRFSLKVDSLRQWQLLDEKMKPGSQFPSVSFTNSLGDSVSLTRFRGTPVYVEVWNPAMDINSKIHASVVSVLSKYRRQELEVYLIALDTVVNTWKEKIRLQNLYFQNVIDLRGSSSPLLNNLGIIQLPANFIIDADGIVLAKNVWGNQLEQGIELLLKK